MVSCNTSMVSGQRAKPTMMNNFITSTGTPNTVEAGANQASPVKQSFFGKNEMEIESGYPSESEVHNRNHHPDADAAFYNHARGNRPMVESTPMYDPLNESKLSLATIARARAP